MEVAAMIVAGAAFAAAPLYLLWLGAIPANSVDKVGVSAEQVAQGNEQPAAEDAA